MARKFFITGGTGLIGRAVVRSLMSQRESVGIEQIALLTRSPERFRAVAPDLAGVPWLRLIAGDMTGADWPVESFTDLIHGATDVNDMQVQDRFAYAWNIADGTRRTLEYASRSGCQRYLYLSSGAVYGPGIYPDAGIPETWDTAPKLDVPTTAYGQGKRFSEHLCALFAEGNDVAVRIARIFSVIGAESPLNGQYALGNFIHEAVSAKADCIRIKGDGTASRSYLNVDDVASWLIALNEHGPRHAVFNVGAEREVTIRELAEIISGLSLRKKPVVVEGKMSNYAGRSRYFPDSSLIRSTLQVRESRPLESAIVELLRRAQA